MISICYCFYLFFNLKISSLSNFALIFAYFEIIYCVYKSKFALNDDFCQVNSRFSQCNLSMNALMMNLIFLIAKDVIFNLFSSNAIQKTSKFTLILFLNIETNFYRFFMIEFAWSSIIDSNIFWTFNVFFRSIEFKSRHIFRLNWVKQNNMMRFATN